MKYPLILPLPRPLGWGIMNCSLFFGGENLRRRQRITVLGLAGIAVLIAAVILIMIAGKAGYRQRKPVTTIGKPIYQVGADGKTLTMTIRTYGNAPLNDEDIKLLLPKLLPKQINNPEDPNSRQ
jgi:hypothetical protein